MDNNEYIDRFYQELSNLETAEARDRLKLAQLFANSVKVETKYDNTAFIVGMAALLSGAKVDVLKEIRALNPRVAKHCPEEVPEWAKNEDDYPEPTCRL